MCIRDRYQIIQTNRKISKTFGSKNPTKRSFQTAWFERFKWLHQDERRDAACCFTCLKALQNGMLSSSNADPAFTKNGFYNWKNTMEKKERISKEQVVWFVWCPPWQSCICIVVVLSGWILMCLFIKMLQRMHAKQDCFYLSIISCVSHPHSFIPLTDQLSLNLDLESVFHIVYKPWLTFLTRRDYCFHWRQRCRHFSLSIKLLFTPFLSSLSLSLDLYGWDCAVLS